jgi:hypothetical protein
MHCAYLTMDDESGWSIDSELVFGPLPALGWQVEPVISPNATDTFLLARETLQDFAPELCARFASRSFVVQPFITNIQTEGEYSLLYFAATFSHAILKTPKREDFRVQEEFGAAILAVEPAAGLLAAGAAVMQRVAPRPVYARCDLVRGADGQFLLMELELIEPSLYLRLDDAAPGKFARAFDAYVRSRLGENRSA